MLWSWRQKKPLFAVSVALLSAAINQTAPAHADQNDQTFYDLLTQNNGWTVTNFPATRANALTLCEHMTNGATPVDAIHEWMSAGNSFKVSNQLVSAAIVAYCPWNAR